MKRKIIAIDLEKCNGCGQCIPNCPEGALQVIDGKARLISDLFCDGLGACIKTCPLDAIAVEEREAEAYDEQRVMDNIVRQGENVIRAHLAHLEEHGEHVYLKQALDYLREKKIAIPRRLTENEAAASFHGCPGSRAIDRRNETDAPSLERTTGEPEAVIPSQLRSWPVQLQLVNPHAAYFADADLLVTADCVPFAQASFHDHFLRGRVPIIFCPKLDRVADLYLAKLTAIFKNHAPHSVTVARMEVPCCGGTTELVRQALAQAGVNIPVNEQIVSVHGEILR